ncbi:glycosaminoglycan attachment site [Endozoicomonas sp. SM1973]|uniref:Glycosaminoglycan attachment site n=1 Tax=Spartinivicinus marinus TaxID=2994442 RepID=A0A853HY94_9GAMM|nr:glycosaminoglycan attachment site [Spartinivicinus marinus]MCX4026936.1 glycosaminoglycan attachment site [Spartinivicinus marinus]NYZ66720.1 glycosaminoglycan attachment site [Spartinivicinus marinus]
MNLFDAIIPVEKQHPIYKLICEEKYTPERVVLLDWADGFIDRDGNFVHEFQSTFEPCLWELYLHACLKELGASIDFSFSRPDFVATCGESICIEATIAAPPVGGAAPYGHDASDIPDDLNEFNSQSTLRICNSFSSKEKKYRESYCHLSHVQGKPFVIAIASFDRPYSHMAAGRPVLSALYGLYHDEEMTIASGSPEVISYNVGGVVKNEITDIPLGYFVDDSYSHISAVVYSSLATWGKIRALADNPNANSVYTTFHPNDADIKPTMKVNPKREYVEDLFDGLYVFHNPFATRPLNKTTLNHSRVAQFFVKEDGELEVIAPNDFLLVRFLQTVNKKM